MWKTITVCGDAFFPNWIHPKAQPLGVGSKTQFNTLMMRIHTLPGLGFHLL